MTIPPDLRELWKGHELYELPRIEPDPWKELDTLPSDITIRGHEEMGTVVWSEGWVAGSLIPPGHFNTFTHDGYRWLHPDEKQSRRKG